MGLCFGAVGVDLCFIAGVKECCHAPLATFKFWNAAAVGGNVVMSLPAGAMISLTAAPEQICTLCSTYSRLPPE